LRIWWTLTIFLLPLFFLPPHFQTAFGGFIAPSPCPAILFPGRGPESTHSPASGSVALTFSSFFDRSREKNPAPHMDSSRTRRTRSPTPSRQWGPYKCQPSLLLLILLTRKPTSKGGTGGIWCGSSPFAMAFKLTVQLLKQLK
jgi:hypothetical protein